MLGSMAVMGIAFTSCSKEDVFNSQAADQLVKAEYEANFIKQYGEINPEETWDFSTMTPISSLGSSVAATRAGGNGNPTMSQGATDMIIEKEVISWVTTNLKAGANNYVKGSPFFMEVPENSFTIVPIFQGQAGYYWQLCMSVAGVSNDIVIWSKGDIEYKNYSTDRNYKTPGDKGMTDAGTKPVYQVKAHTYTFSNYPTGAKMYFYLKVWDNYTTYYNNVVLRKQGTWNRGKWISYSPRVLTSLNYQMLGLKGLQIPAAIASEYTEENVTFIGCEDTEITKTADRDYEDLVFMMYGKPAPPISHVDVETVSVGKRYLIEDLGATNDFDFNDVVVDVMEEYQNQIYYKNIDAEGNKEFDHKSEIPGTRHQKAIIRAMGGTRDFTLTIGDKTWTKSESGYNVKDMLNTGWNGTVIEENKVLAEFDVTNWNPELNNISISVESQGDSDGFFTISFPKKGKVPMIVATDMTPLTPWQHEKEIVPDWWYDEE
ncbi:MAG: hypothetical protein J5797_07880 [Prevotella sp.]|nr:hypothetical protein [Prevotella sp.]